MAILNATTAIDEHKTVGEIQKLLASKGAQSIMVDYGEGGVPTALRFQMSIRNTPVPFALPARFEGVKRVMLNEIKSKSLQSKRSKEPKFEEQVRRVSWRILRTWISAQMALVEAGQAEMAEVFLPYVVSGNKTFYEHMLTNPKLLALGPGD